MSTVRSFSDTSAVSLAYIVSDVADEATAQGEAFNYLPYTTEGFQMSKEPKMSTAITKDRRPNNSKNTKGTASGAATIEFGAAPFVLDLLSVAMMAEWTQVDEAVPASGVYLTDGEMKKYLVVEKSTRSGAADTDPVYHERFYGCAINDATIEFGDGELITMASNIMALSADYDEAAAGADGLGGSLAASKAVPADYEIADSSNNLKSVTLRNSAGDPLEVVFSDLSMQIQNNVREQPGLGSEFSAGIGFGKVAVTLSGEIYFFDQSILKAHMTNQRLSASFEIDTSQGTFKFEFPNLMAQTPTNNAEGENADYKTSLTLSAERGTATIGGEAVECIVAITYVAKP